MLHDILGILQLRSKSYEFSYLLLVSWVVLCLGRTLSNGPNPSHFHHTWTYFFQAHKPLLMEKTPPHKYCKFLGTFIILHFIVLTLMYYHQIQLRKMKVMMLLFNLGWAIDYGLLVMICWGLQLFLQCNHIESFCTLASHKNGIYENFICFTCTGHGS